MSEDSRAVLERMSQIKQRLDANFTPRPEDVEWLLTQVKETEVESPKEDVEIRRYGAGSGWTVPRFFRSALFPLVVIVVVVFIASRFIGG